MPDDARASPETDAPATPADVMAELRELLLGPERQRVSQLQDRLDHFDLSPEAVSRVLPEAIKMRSAANVGTAGGGAAGGAAPAAKGGNGAAGAVDKRLADSLAPTIEQSLRTSIRKDPGPLVDVLFPLMGPVIRKSIADALAKMVQSLNQAMEHSLSLRGWKWRVEARRTGKSFAEVVLLHTLVYSVDQVFLIHRESGLMLAHVVSDTLDVQRDADMISGMFTAIRDFVKDSFGVGEGEDLDDLCVGGRTVWVRQEPRAVLAAVISGTAPVALREQLQATLARIHGEHLEALAAFDGDTGRFEAVLPQLRKLLIHSEKLPDAPAPPGASDAAPAKPARKLPVPLLVATAVSLLALGTRGFFSWRETSRWDRYLAWLRSQPGVVVLEAKRQSGRYVVSGLRDPAADPAADPVKQLSAERLDPARADFHWQPYQSLAPALVERRAKAALRPPPSVRLALSDDGTLRATGSAPPDWVAAARVVAPALGGVTGFDPAGLTLECEPSLLEKARSVLRPPDGVTLHVVPRPATGPAGAPAAPEAPATYEGEVIAATGRAPHAWVEQAERLAPLLRGVSRFDASGLTDVDGPEAILSRACTALGPPDTVSLRAEDGTLTAAGRAPHEWVLRARRIAAGVTGVRRYDDAGLVDADLERVGLLTREVEAARVRFVRYNSDVPPDQGGGLDAAADAIRRLLAAAEVAAAAANVRVVGHTDWVGTGEGKMRVSQLRARNVTAALVARGVPADRLTAVGVGDAPEAEAREADQLVTFEVTAADPSLTPPAPTTAPAPPAPR